MSWNFERIAGPFKGAMGGVAWDGTSVLFSLLDEMEIQAFDPEAGTAAVRRRYVGRLNGLAVAPSGSVFAAQESGRRVIELVPDGSARVTATRFDGAIHNYPCDLAVDAQERVWFSDSHSGVQVFGPKIYPMLDHASVMRLERDDRRSWAIRRVTFDTRSPRAVMLSADERTLFVSEGDVHSPTPRELRAYPVRDDGSVEPYRLLHTFGSDHRGAHRGIEGLCRDRHDRVIGCAGSSESGPGPMLMIFGADGRLLETHAFPGEAPLRCAFGGLGRPDLYVSSTDGWLYRATGVNE
ncbi:MAG: hypothetical protein JWQ11_2014 [Rhizobacter sp.]|nr:hypothetical protein [Rhizobacter sp.]